jgi:hypothetical protein
VLGYVFMIVVCSVYSTGLYVTTIISWYLVLSVVSIMNCGDIFRVRL